MIEGLRYLPVVQARRAKQSDLGAPPNFLDCDDCPLPERPMFRCGWMRESEWVDGMRPFPEASVCPGYSTRLPEVHEAARALSWQKRGGLAPLYGAGELPACAVDAIDILESARGEAEAEHYREMRAERERG